MKILKHPVTIILLLIVLALLGWTLVDFNDDNLDISVNPTTPTYKSDDMLTTVYDPTGKLSYKLIAVEVEHYTDKGETWFTKPVMTLFDENAKESWKVRSNRAKLTDDKMLYLYGQVEVDNLGHDSQIEKIKTENAQINLVTQDIMSEDKVTLLGNNLSSNGFKMRGNLRQKIIKLLENVNTYYGKTI